VKEIPMADVLRERLSLALDQYADSERQKAALQSENGAIKGELDRERAQHRATAEELQRLKELHMEEVRLVRATEFRRGARTNNE
jgi:hypothetical protein